MGKNKVVKGLDLKSSEDVEKLKQLCRTSDVFLDPYRPGVLEKLGLDPAQLLEVRLQVLLQQNSRECRMLLNLLIQQGVREPAPFLSVPLRWCHSLVLPLE